MRYGSYILASMLLLNISCKDVVRSETDYWQWLNNEANGYRKLNKSESTQLVARLVPNDLVWMRADENQPNTDDSLLYFLLTYELLGDTKGLDVLEANVDSYQGYKEKYYEMNFGLEGSIWLKVDGKEYLPALYNTENTFGLSKNKNIMIIFEKHWEDGKSLQLVVDDILSNSGINKFYFDASEMRPLPKVKVQ